MKLSHRQTFGVWRNGVKQFRVLRGLSLAIGFFCVSAAYAELLPIKTYTVADGLLRDNVYKIKQDSRGSLWFCTVEGVSRFDGYAFTNFITDDGLPDRHANDFLETKSGEIYVATDGGLARLNPIGRARFNRKSFVHNSLFIRVIRANSRRKFLFLQISF